MFCMHRMHLNKKTNVYFNWARNNVLLVIPKRLWLNLVISLVASDTSHYNITYFGGLSAWSTSFMLVFNGILLLFKYQQLASSKIFTNTPILAILLNLELIGPI